MVRPISSYYPTANVSIFSVQMKYRYLTTCLACLVLAFIRSWSLTLVILSAFPILMFVQALSQAARPLLESEREHTGVSATIINRAISAISTVKVFNAVPYEKFEDLLYVLENNIVY